MLTTRELFSKSQLKKLISGVLLVGTTFTTIAEIESTGLRFLNSPKLAILRQDIYISPDNINLSYLLQNTASVDRFETMVFSIPNSNTGYQQHIEEPISEFSINVAGKPIAYFTKIRAIANNGIDITAKLQRYKISPDIAIAKQQLQQVTSATMQNLTATSLLDDKQNPAWSTHVFHYWQQKLPNNTTLPIKLSYRPAKKHIILKHNKRNIRLTTLTEKIINKKRKDKYSDVYKLFEDNAIDLNAYCPTDDTLAKLHAMQQQNKAIVARELNINLTQDSVWLGPAEVFNLVIEKKNRQEPLLCWAQAVDNNKKSLLFHANNFTPTKNLNILFIADL